MSHRFGVNWYDFVSITAEAAEVIRQCTANQCTLEIVEYQVFFMFQIITKVDVTHGSFVLHIIFRDYRFQGQYMTQCLACLAN